MLRLKLTPETTGYFKRNDSIPKIGFEREIASTAFTLSEKNKFPEEAIKGQKGYFVIKFNDRRQPPLDGFEKEKEQIRLQLLQQKALKLIDAWITRKKSESEIQIEEGFWKS